MIFASQTVRGQYAGYRSEEGVPEDSQTATYAAIKLYCDNWRWKDVFLPAVAKECRAEPLKL